jgi:hypothetical protein
MIEIVASIKRVTDIVGEISASSTEQSAGVYQVGQAVGQIDQVTQQNAALVEESAAAAESLRAQAQQFVEAVSVFRIGGDAVRSESGRRGIELAESHAKLNRPVATKAAFKRRRRVGRVLSSVSMTASAMSSAIPEDRSPASVVRANVKCVKRK